MRVVRQIRADAEERCAACGYVGRTVLVVEMLPGRGGSAETAEPAEYAWACPECLAVEQWDDEWEGDDDDDDDDA